MKRIKTYKAFEASTENTYLEPKNFTSALDKITDEDISMAKRLYGKIFKEAPTTKDKSWGIEFELIDDFELNYSGEIDENDPNKDLVNQRYEVVFTDAFFKSFIKKNADDSWWKKFLSIFGIGDISFESLKTRIICEPYNANRIHFPEGISEDFKGIGLGYAIYESFIKFLGYASSGTSASQLAQKVWSQVAGDPDFYTVISRTARSGKLSSTTSRSGAILAVHKDCSQDITKEICGWMTKQAPAVPNDWSNSEGDWRKVAFEGFSIDPALLSKYPNVKKTFDEMQKSAFYQSIDDDERH